MQTEHALDMALPESTAQEQAESREPKIEALEARTLALIALAVLVAAFALHAGATFFIPLLVSVFLSYSLSPVVDRMESWHIPRALSSAITMAMVVGATAASVQLALGAATDVLEDLPRSVQRMRQAVTSWQMYGDGPLKQVQNTADELQKLAGATTAAASAAPTAAPSATFAPAATPAPAAPPTAESKTFLAVGTLTMGIFIGQLVSVLFLTYFLLAAGDLFRRRLMQMTGPSLTARRKALQIVRQIHVVSQRYFALVFAVNILVGIVTAVGLYFLGVRHPAFWGIAMAVLHTIPYLGAGAIVGAVGLVAYAQFETVGMAFAAAMVPLAAASLLGIWLQTALMGRAARMNAVVVFVALLFWGMVWGGWGLLLAFPIMATIKIVFGEVERLKPLALLMSD